MRKAYKIVVRCMLTGADWHLVRWLKEAGDAHQVAARSLKHDATYHHDYSRIVEVREADQVEIAEHKARIAAL